MIGPRPQNKHDRRRGKTAIITGSPYKLELEEEEREKKERERTQKLKKRAAKTSLLNLPKTKQTRRKRKPSGDAKQADKVKKCYSEPEKNPQSSFAKIEENGPKIRKPKKKSSVSQGWTSSSSEDEAEKDEACIFCNALYL